MSGSVPPSAQMIEFPAEDITESECEAERVRRRSPAHQALRMEFQRELEEIEAAERAAWRDANLRIGD